MHSQESTSETFSDSAVTNRQDGKVADEITNSQTASNRRQQLLEVANAVPTLTEAMNADLTDLVDEYGEDWPSFKAMENARLMKVRYWAIAGNDEQVIKAQQELFEFWDNPRPL